MGLGLLLWTRYDPRLPTRLQTIRLLDSKKFVGDVLLEHGESKLSTFEMSSIKCQCIPKNTGNRYLKNVSAVSEK